MDGIHDLGGMHGFGPVPREPGEPLFHAPWEPVVVAFMRDGRREGLFNIDEFRHAIERMPPARYLTTSYYERWLDGITRLLMEKGIVDERELEARAGALAGAPGTPEAAMVPEEASRLTRTPERWPPIREGAARPRFAPEDPVVTRGSHPAGHTRLPRYARGKRGVVRRVHGIHVFPDTHAHGLGEAAQPLYSVRFEAAELWAEAAEPRQAVHLDLWESYLEPGG